MGFTFAVMTCAGLVLAPETRRELGAKVGGYPYCGIGDWYRALALSRGISWGVAVMFVCCKASDFHDIAKSARGPASSRIFNTMSRPQYYLDGCTNMRFARLF